MRSLIIFAFIACASAVSPPAVAGPVASILRSDNQMSPEGNFQYGYETDNGISSSALGTVKAVNKDEVALEVSGSNSYTSPEGQKIELTYVANEFGYQPQGAHLPVAPEPQPIPEYIVRAIEYIRTHPSVETVENGKQAIKASLSG